MAQRVAADAGKGLESRIRYDSLVNPRSQQQEWCTLSLLSLGSRQHGHPSWFPSAGTCSWPSRAMRGCVMERARRPVHRRGRGHASEPLDDPEFCARYRQLRRSKASLVHWSGQGCEACFRRWRVYVCSTGCRFGAFARWARERGAARVLGVDRSKNMLARARTQTQDPGVTYALADIEQGDSPWHFSRLLQTSYS